MIQEDDKIKRVALYEQVSPDIFGWKSRNCFISDTTPSALSALAHSSTEHRYLKDSSIKHGISPFHQFPGESDPDANSKASKKLREV